MYSSIHLFQNGRAPQQTQIGYISKWESGEGANPHGLWFGKPLLYQLRRAQMMHWFCTDFAVFCTRTFRFLASAEQLYGVMHRVQYNGNCSVAFGSKNACMQTLDCERIWLLHLSLSGKNALHLASRNGHSLCVQKLLQVKCRCSPLCSSSTICTWLIFTPVRKVAELHGDISYLVVLLVCCISTHSTVCIFPQSSFPVTGQSEQFPFQLL